MEPIGAIVPLTVLPRFSSFVGPGEYTTAPMRVEDFVSAELMFWRGPLVVSGSPTTPFEATFEESHDTTVWTPVSTAPNPVVTTFSTVDPYQLTFGKRWFRVRVVLDAEEVDEEKFVGITLWMSGVLQKRVARD